MASQPLKLLSCLYLRGTNPNIYRGGCSSRSVYVTIAEQDIAANKADNQSG